jgi:hypothetical protein
VLIGLLLRPILPYLLLGIGLLAGGQALGLPIAETMIDALIAAFWSVVDWVADAIVSWIRDQLSFLSIAFETPTAG